MVPAAVGSASSFCISAASGPLYQTELGHGMPRAERTSGARRLVSEDGS